jgi:hypothetical protein
MNMMGPLPETEILMKKEPKADLGPVVPEFVQGQSSVFGPIPVDDRKRSARFQVLDSVLQPGLLIPYIMEAVIGDDHVEIPSREDRIVFERQDCDDILVGRRSPGVGLQGVERIRLDIVSVNDSAPPHLFGKEKGEKSRTGAYFTDSHSRQDTDQPDDIAWLFALPPAPFRRPQRFLALMVLGEDDRGQHQDQRQRLLYVGVHFELPLTCIRAASWRCYLRNGLKLLVAHGLGRVGGRSPIGLKADDLFWGTVGGAFLNARKGVTQKI